MRPGMVLMITGDPEAPGVCDVAQVVPKPVNFDQFIAQIRVVLGSNWQDTASDDVAA